MDESLRLLCFVAEVVSGYFVATCCLMVIGIL
jgi:hypothetical protein